MKKVIIAALALVLVAVAVITALVFRPQESTWVEISQDGTVLHRIDLANAEPQTFEVEYHGHINTVQIDENGIRVLHADCPDQTCVNMGYLSENGLPIVCLPNHLVIQFASDVGDTDAVA